MHPTADRTPETTTADVQARWPSAAPECPPTSLVGRDTELAELRRLVRGLYLDLPAFGGPLFRLTRERSPSGRRRSGSRSPTPLERRGGERRQENGTAGFG